MALGCLALCVFQTISFHKCMKLTHKLIGLLCFIIGACCIFAQVLLYIWLQESKAVRISLTVLAGFSVMPLVTFMLAPFANVFRVEGSKDQTPDAKSISSRSDVENAPRTPGSPLSSIYPFPSVHSPAPGQHSPHRSSGAPLFNGKKSPYLGSKESYEFRVGVGGNAT